MITYDRLGLIFLVKRTLSRSNIIVLNLLALIKGHGYRIRDCMYYVKEKGEGKKEMETT
jgi:hypothetical protein